MTQDNDTSHFNRTPRRKAEFIVVPNTLKKKVGSGGLSEDILAKAETLLTENTVDFRPLGEMYLQSLMQGVEKIRASDVRDDDHLLSFMLYPAMQLKANGGMFHYPLVTVISNHLIGFLEVIDKADDDVLDVVTGFHTAIKVILNGQIKGNGGARGQELVTALTQACQRYFDKK